MKKKQFYIQGIYHKLLVKVVSRKSITEMTNDDTCIGAYVHEDGEIFIARTLTPQVALHTLYHEIAHSIIETLENMSAEEDRCDVLGSYLMRLTEDREMIAANFAEEEK